MSWSEFIWAKLTTCREARSQMLCWMTVSQFFLYICNGGRNIRKMAWRSEKARCGNGCDRVTGQSTRSRAPLRVVIASQGVYKRGILLAFHRCLTSMHKNKGHGWLKVKINLLQARGVTRAIRNSWSVGSITKPVFHSQNKQTKAKCLKNNIIKAIPPCWSFLFPCNKAPQNLVA